MLAALKIKEDKKSSFAYVRSKTKCKAQVGPLCNTQGQEVNDALDMAESFNAQFLSVFTAEVRTHPILQCLRRYSPVMTRIN